MTSSRSAGPLDIRLRPSQLLARYLGALAVLLVVALYLLPLPLWAKLALMICCLAQVVMYWRRRVMLRGRHTVTGIRYRDQRWQLLTVAGSREVVCRGATVWPWLVALDMRAGLRRYPVLVLRDSVDADSLRRLRQLLIQGGA